MSISLISVVFSCVLAAGGDAPQTDSSWTRFRGPNGSGVSADSGLPSQIGPEANVAWKMNCGLGLSSPIVAGGRLYLTSFDGPQRFLEAFDAGTGDRLWKLEMTREREVNFTPPNGPATATPVVHRDQVFAFFSDAGLLAASTDGQELWRMPIVPPASMHGIASSLVVAGDQVILLADQLESSFIAAFDCATGHEAWRQDRFNGFTGGFSTPTVYESESGTRELLVFGPLELVAYDAETGERLWWVTGMGNSPVGLPILSGRQAIVSEPVFEPLPFSILAGLDRNQDGRISPDEHGKSSMNRFIEKIDREVGNADGTLEKSEWDKSQETIKGKGGLAAIELGGRSDVTQTHIKWTYKKQVPYVPSVLLYQGVLYMVQDGGLVTTFDPDSGEVLQRGRLSQGGGQFWASPVAADGKIFVVNTEGNLTVLQAGRDWKELSFGELGEQAWATPAIAGGAVYVRTEKTLWCFRK